MGRKIELVIYSFIILFFIFRYADTDMEDGRGSGGPQTTPPPAVMLPDGADLPAPDGTVMVELEHEVRSGVGTAFSVDSGGTFVTARHVIDGCQNVFFVQPRGGLEKVRSVRWTRNRDFAVLGSGETNNFHVSLMEKQLDRGTEGFMMGFPQGDPADVRATVIGRSEMRSVGRYRMREPVVAWVERERRPRFSGSLQGISGGPVFDGEGNVVGTVVAGAPRRGRVFTTHPHVFDETGLLEQSREGRTPVLRDGIHPGNYHRIGDAFRKSGVIRQVYCEAR